MNRTSKNLARTFFAALTVISCQEAGATFFYDLTAGGTATINGGVFNTIAFKTAGTGVIDPFLRIQQSGNSTFEAGYNTSLGTPLNNDNSWNYNVLLSSLQIVNSGGVDYFDFRLDLNEPDNGKDNQITLNQLMVYGNNSPAPLGVTMDSATGRPVGTIGTLLWDMNAGSDPTANAVLLDYGLRGGGSGDGDMQFLVPTSVFQGQTYVVLYSQFGLYPITNGVPSDAGFEEWNVVKGANTVIPEPSTVVAGALLLLPLAAAGFRRLRN
jgi:hypothetical protein